MKLGILTLAFCSSCGEQDPHEMKGERAKWFLCVPGAIVQAMLVQTIISALQTQKPEAHD